MLGKGLLVAPMEDSIRECAWQQERGGGGEVGCLLGKRQVMAPRMRTHGGCNWQQIEDCGEVKDLGLARDRQ